MGCPGGVSGCRGSPYLTCCSSPNIGCSFFCASHPATCGGGGGQAGTVPTDSRCPPRFPGAPQNPPRNPFSAGKWAAPAPGSQRGDVTGGVRDGGAGERALGTPPPRTPLPRPPLRDTAPPRGGWDQAGGGREGKGKGGGWGRGRERVGGWGWGGGRVGEGRVGEGLIHSQRQNVLLAERGSDVIGGSANSGRRGSARARPRGGGDRGSRGSAPAGGAGEPPGDPPILPGGLQPKVTPGLPPLTGGSR